MLSLLTAGVTIFLIDQWSKRTVRAHAQGHVISLGPMIQIRLVTGLKKIYARRFSRIVLVAIWLTAVTAAIVLHSSGAWFQSNLGLLGLGLAIGGAAGNLLDILRWRHVVDFIDLRWWPVFNIADMAIILGLTMAFWPQA